jgi:hypothetical protein
MDRKIRSKAGQAIYVLRKSIVEPVFGQIKAARGLDRFLLRGLENVTGEWHLIAITHNLRKLHKAALARARGKGRDAASLSQSPRDGSPSWSPGELARRLRVFETNS